MCKQLKVGVVGCGSWGPNLVRNFRSLPDCHLKMICDISQERLQHLTSLYPDIQGELDYDQMLNGVNLDAVVVATPVKWHYPMAKAALLAGKHVFVEKPMAPSSQQCAELVAIARHQRLVLMVGHAFLYSPAVRKIKEIVDRGDLGEIRHVCARRLNPGVFQKDINVAWDLAWHDIFIILYLLEQFPISVNCRGSASLIPEIEDVTSMSLTFQQERTAIIHSSWLDPRTVRELTIVGSKRMIVYDDVAPQEKIRFFDAGLERPPHNGTFARFHPPYFYEDSYSPHITQEQPLKTQCRHFLDCIQNGKVPLTNGSRGMDLVKILEASSQSLKLGGGQIVLRRPEPARLSTNRLGRALRRANRKQLSLSARTTKREIQRKA
jgi:predicted dehydrogenase